MQTYGDRPIPFRLDSQNGEYYYFASKVGKYLRMFKGSLFKSYPSLWRRLVTVEERKKLVSLGLIPRSLTKNITILKASEVNEIFAGRGEEYKIRFVTPEEFDDILKDQELDVEFNAEFNGRRITPAEFDSILQDYRLGFDYNSDERFVTPAEFDDILKDRELELHDRMHGTFSEY